MNPVEHHDHDRAAPDEQPMIADGFTLLQRHHVSDSFGYDGGKAAEHQRRHGDEDKHAR